MSAVRVSTVCFNLRTIYASSLFQNGLKSHRCCTQLEFTRYRRRPRRPMWWIKDKDDKGIGFQSLDLTRENQAFMREVAEDRLKTSPVKGVPWERNPWRMNTIRCGVIAIKLGSYPLYLKDGKKQNCVLYQVLDNHVIRYKTPDEMSGSVFAKKKWNNKYGACIVGALSCDPFKFNKEYNDMFKEAGLPPKRKLSQMLVSPSAKIEAGTPLYATHFKVGQYVDVQARTIGHGFQGVMKRWGFSGGTSDARGSSKFHRRPGSIGFGKSYVQKGKKMPGRMGFRVRTHRGLKVLRINTKYNVLYLSGALSPGPNHCYTNIYDTQLPLRRLKMQEDPPLMPTFYPDLDSKEPLPEEINDDSLFDFSSPSIVYVEDKSKKKKAKG